MVSLEKQIEQAFQQKTTRLRLVSTFTTDLPASIGTLKHLEQLDLKGCNIRSLPREIAQLQQLKALDLSYNQFSRLPEEIGRLRQLQKLNLANNFLNQLPVSIGQLFNLQDLDLQGNMLTQLPSALSGLSNLKRLDLAGNLIDPTSFSIQQLGNLRFLRIEIKTSGVLPIFLTQLEYLEELRIRGTKITGLPETFYWLKKLKVLVLDLPKLEQLPDGFGKMPRLEKLIINGSKIKSLPESFFELISLKNLDLCRNHIREISPLIRQLKNLRILKLTDNRIKSVPSEIGKNTSLYFIDLDENPINEFPEVLCFLPQLEHLRLPASVYRPIPKALALLDQKVRILIPEKSNFLEPIHRIQSLRSYFNVVEADRGFKTFCLQIINIDPKHQDIRMSMDYLTRALHAKNQTFLRQKALRYISEKYQAGTQKIKPRKKILLSGIFEENRSRQNAETINIEDQLIELQLEITKNHKEADFILIGQKPDLNLLNKTPKSGVLLTLKDLKLHLHEQLLKGSKQDDEFWASLKQIGMLIKHPSVENANLGFQLLGGNRLTPLLLNTLLIKILLLEFGSKKYNEKAFFEIQNFCLIKLLILGPPELSELMAFMHKFKKEFIEPFLNNTYDLSFKPKLPGIDLRYITAEIAQVVKRQNS